MTSQVMCASVQQNLPVDGKKCVDHDLYVLEEELMHFKEYHWVMFNGKTFSKKVRDAHHEPIQDDYLDDIITYNNATVTWLDAYGVNHSVLCAPEITFRYVMNSILYHYKRTRRTPSKVCILERILYNPFTHMIRVVFGS